MATGKGCKNGSALSLQESTRNDCRDLEEAVNLLIENPRKSMKNEDKHEDKYGRSLLTKKDWVILALPILLILTLVFLHFISSNMLI